MAKDSVWDFVHDYADKHRKDCFLPIKTFEERVPSGTLKLDKILAGGIPLGYITQIFGREKSGKTTTIYHLLASAQRLKLDPVLIDAEFKYDPKYAAAIGVDTSKFMPISMSAIEDVFEFISQVLDNTDCKFIAVDSVGGIAAKAFLENSDFEKKPQIGSSAMAIQHGLMKILARVVRQKVAVVFVNQLRTNIATVGPSLEKPMGGNYLQFASTLKLATKLVNSKILEDDVRGLAGIKTSIRVHKGQVPGIVEGSQVELSIFHGVGIDKEYELLDVAIELGILKAKGSWLIYENADETIRAQGRPSFLEMLKDANQYDSFKKLVTDTYTEIPLEAVEGDMDSVAIDDELPEDDETDGGSIIAKAALGDD